MLASMPLAVQGFLLGSPENLTKAERPRKPRPGTCSVRASSSGGPWGGVRGHGRCRANNSASKTRVIPHDLPKPSRDNEEVGRQGSPLKQLSSVILAASPVFTPGRGGAGEGERLGWAAASTSLTFLIWKGGP